MANGKLILATISIFICSPASAYLGPGAGLSAIGSILALIAAILLIAVGFLWYPIKRLLGKSRTQQNENSEKSSDSKPE
jgi:hypothetical protein